MYSSTDVNPDYAISRFVVVGVNYRHANVTERGLFSISEASCTALLQESAERGFKSIFALSTCNRIELYAYCHNEIELINLLLKYTNGTAALFERTGIVRKGMDALDHLFHVAAGLDSQIIGDYEILGQLKKAVAFSRKHGMIGPVMDRTVNTAIQASRAVKMATKLSIGTVSVSYAAIEWLQKIPRIAEKHLLLYGIGKFGTALAKNLKIYFPASSITIVNRTDEKANDLASSLSVQWKQYSQLSEAIQDAEVVVACANGADYIIDASLLAGKAEKWILDLSVPENVHPSVKELENIHLASVDDVSALLQNTLADRNQEVPGALSVIEDYKARFFEWLSMRRHVPMINDTRVKLNDIGDMHFFNLSDPSILPTLINKAIGDLALNLRDRKEKGCHYIKTISEFIQQDFVNG